MIGTTLVSNQLYGQLAETPAAFSGSPDGTGLPEKAVEGRGGGGHHLPLLVKAILQALSCYNHSMSSDVPVHR
ncbi:unnamed protein product [Staurois parvus]|uniref:Uncharacterized protein n=1 Tax=Staurois parvus TaxID=386267 RepID=A0ABN9GR57_9NEOB|nr:unnamed protein product [Staurois parvus]